MRRWEKTKSLIKELSSYIRGRDTQWAVTNARVGASNARCVKGELKEAGSRQALAWKSCIPGSAFEKGPSKNWYEVVIGLVEIMFWRRYIKFFHFLHCSVSTGSYGFVVAFT